jgi:hypothetical protein
VYTAVRYCAFGQLLESDEPIPELPTASAEGDARFTIARRARVDCPPDLRWSAVWTDAGTEPDVLFARASDALFLRFGDLIRVEISRGLINIAADLTADSAALRHVLLDKVLPLALAAEGETVLHASAVGMDGAAVLFVGGAGSGKSTLAAALSACGAAVLADDGVLLEGRGAEVRAVPAYRGLRLWPDAAERAGARGFSTAPPAAGSRKHRLVPNGSEGRPPALPVAVVYSLRPCGATPRMTRLSRRDATLELVRHAFTPDVDGRAAILAHLHRAAGWSARLEFWSLAAPRDLSQLHRLASAVVAHAGGCRASAG